MIFFEKLRYKNLLSTGNEFTEITLNKSPTTLITGKNGHGKTTIINALIFCLYGRCYSGINKPQLVNSITRKNLVTELEFTIGSTQYLVRRGIKPNLFEIYQNGNLIDQTADIKEYQDLLEKNIIKINYKSFCQTVILGSTNYKPFMSLSTGERREVVEDLLDIQIFTKMNSILKSKMESHKIDIINNTNKISLLEQQIKSHEDKIKALEENNQEIIDQKEEQKINLRKNIDDVTNEIKNIENIISQIDQKSLNFDKLQNKKNTIEKLKIEIQNKINNISKNIKFFEDNDDCPTCKQPIDFKFKSESISTRKEKLNKLVDGIEQLNTQLIEVNDLITTNLNINKKISDLNVEISKNNSYIKNYYNSISIIDNEIESIKKKNIKNQEDDNDIINIKSNLIDEKKEKYNLENKTNIFKASQFLLKDSGIKAKIISKYIPIINQHINKYLNDLDFFVNFQLDENFNEIIKSRNRDDFTYQSFSEGEKMRLNLALTFAWRAVARARNSAATNLLIMDEVGDSSLDEQGVECLLKIIDDLSKDTNIFVISHHSDRLFDKFRSIIKIEKKNNFSKIV